MTNPALMKRYLLGTASEGERSELEDKYLSDAEVFEELTAAENDLIDSYARGNLSGSEKYEFERRYINSKKGRARAEFSRTLVEISSESRQTAEAPISLWGTLRSYFRMRSPVLQWGLVATCAAIVATVVGSRHLQQDRDLQAGLKNQQTQTAPSPPQTAPNPTFDSRRTEVAKTEMPPIAEFTIQLDPGISRTVGSSTPKAFVVPSGTRWLSLQLAFEGDNEASYTAVLETPEGREVDRIPGLKSRSSSGRESVAARLPVRLVPAGDYVLELNAAGNDLAESETIESYTFRILYK